MRKNSLTIFVLTLFLGVIITAGYNIYKISALSNNGHYYGITIPGNRYQDTTFFTNEYVEKDGCVSFVDEFNRQHKVYGSYNIEKY